MPGDASFVSLLAANRSRFNAKFAEARRRWPRLDPAIFSEVLRQTVAPIVAAVEAANPARVSEATEALYDLALELLGKELLGPQSRYPHVVAGWRELLPRLPQFVAEAPRRLVGSLTNALYTLSITPGARPHEWAGGLLRLAEVCPDAATLLKAGQVAAWRAGLAYYRSGALALCRMLDPTVVCVALGLASSAALPDPAALVNRLEANPWLSPEGAARPSADKLELKMVARVGAFRGFGGVFLAPPRVLLSAGNFIVRDGENYLWLTADLFGATWHRLPELPASPTTSSRAFRVEPGGRVCVDAYRYQQKFPELETYTSFASDGVTLAVTTALSHAVYLLALVDEK